MKKLFILCAMALTVVGCGGDPKDPIDPKPDGENGMIRIVLAPKDELNVVVSKAAQGADTKADTKADTDLGSFAVVIKDSKGESYSSYASYSEIPAELAMPEGDYVIEARNGQEKSAGFDMPHYYGASPLKVEVGKTVDVNVQCLLTNVKVTVVYTSEMLTALRDVKVNVMSKYDATNSDKVGYLQYTVDEKRAGWFAVPHDKSMEVQVEGFNRSTDERVSHSIKLNGVAARQWRQVTVNVLTSGGAGVGIVLDTTTISRPDDNISIPDSEDVIDNNGDNGNWEDGTDPEVPDVPRPPTVIGSSLEGSPFDIDDVVSIVIADGVNNVLDVEMKSTHKDGIGNLFLTIESEALKDLLESVLGITGEIDLANPVAGSQWKAMFEDPMIGLLDPAVPIKGKQSHMFSVGPLMSLLGALPGAFDAPHNFHLRVVDGNGETVKTLVIELSN